MRNYKGYWATNIGEVRLLDDVAPNITTEKERLTGVTCKKTLILCDDVMSYFDVIDVTWTSPIKLLIVW